ncbi:DNA polymerase III subunit beta [Psychrobacter sp. I-STPA10]|uniref:DNA polymerase III subunit beta n=1 Tax=Psychrobacter sp. I-STPA10 TaxID=2585769 RepID=UPI001E295DBE|nr:DNA polymerase III subunit beta [Psychrobacter sp. I-STPA10]
MELNINRDLLFKAIDLIFKAVDKRPNMTILGNIKLELSPSTLTLIVSDLEVELMATINLPEGAVVTTGAITLPTFKLKDICKFLPDNAMIKLRTIKEGRCELISGKSRFILGTLPAEDFPVLDDPENITSLTLKRSVLLDLIASTEFAMAIQDVRYYLTGMLFEVDKGEITTVATDGHRLALSHSTIDVSADLTLQAILPGKAVSELERLLTSIDRLVEDAGKKNKWKWQELPDSLLELKFGREFLRAEMSFGEVDNNGLIDNSLVVTFKARLIDGKFPDYRRVVPSMSDKSAILPGENISTVLRRVAILSNEKSRGVIFNFAAANNVEIKANNAEHDKAVEMLQIVYQGDPIELSFNASYLLDVLDVLHKTQKRNNKRYNLSPSDDVLQGDVQLHMSQSNASVLINQVHDSQHQYVIMPMRI